MTGSLLVSPVRTAFQLDRSPSAGQSRTSSTTPSGSGGPAAAGAAAFAADAQYQTSFACLGNWIKVSPVVACESTATGKAVPSAAWTAISAPSGRSQDPVGRRATIAFDVDLVTSPT